MAQADPVVTPTHEAGVHDHTFETVYARYFGFVWRCLRGLGVAESQLDDAAQDVFVVVHRKLAEFRRESSLRTWLYGIVRNVASNHRRSHRRQAASVTLEVEPASAGADPHEQLLVREHTAFVQAFLATVSPDKRDVFVLVLLEELPVPEVAQMLQVPVNTAYTRLRTVRGEFERALHRRRQAR